MVDNPILIYIQKKSETILHIFDNNQYNGTNNLLILCIKLNVFINFDIRGFALWQQDT